MARLGFVLIGLGAPCSVFAASTQIGVESSQARSLEAGLLPVTTSPAPMPTGQGILTEANLLLLDVQLDGFYLSDVLTAHQAEGEVWLPLGELSRLLSLALSVNALEGRVAGFVAEEARSFELNVSNQVLSLAGQPRGFVAGQVRLHNGDLYLPARLLSEWLPIMFEVNIASLRLWVKPRVKLPLQTRLEREALAQRLTRGSTQADDPGYPRSIAPHAWLSTPMIDLTLGAAARNARGSPSSDLSYAAYITADIAGMDGAVYLSGERNSTRAAHRLTLGRNDPDGGLLGPLRARSVTFGNITVPNVANVMTRVTPAGTNNPGTGLSLSNRPLSLSTSFDRQSLRGDLPPGWDVTLYYNDALAGFQASRGDGLYAFDDLPLSYGPNDFLLVFNGPLGQMRTEQRSFMLDQSVLQPGQLLYGLTHHQARNGELRTLTRLDLGLSRQISGSAGFYRIPRLVIGKPVQTEPRQYSQFGLRAYFPSMILTGELTHDRRGGLLGDFGVKTRLGRFAVDYQRIQAQEDFDSDVFGLASNPVRQRDQLRLQGGLMLKDEQRLPVGLDLRRDRLFQGIVNDQVSGRVSFLALNTFFTKGLEWRSSRGIGNPSTSSVAGTLQFNRRLASVGLSGQLGYTVHPGASFDTLAVAADRLLDLGYRLNGGVIHDMLSGSTVITAGFSKSLGRYALALSGSISNRREYTLGLQLFVGLSRDPRAGRWLTEAVPIAGAGSVAARAFVDSNMNGIHDRGEEFVPNAGFILNRGGRLPVRTDENGLATLSRLSPGRYKDIGLDPGTLEDPQWMPATKGVRVLPRPGVVQAVDFAVVYTSDIDGTVFLIEPGRRRAIGDVVIELVDSQGRVAYSSKSASDGFYTLTQVIPGEYILRISPEQIDKLGLQEVSARRVKVSAEGDFISGEDLEVLLPSR